MDGVVIGAPVLVRLIAAAVFQGFVSVSGFAVIISGRSSDDCGGLSAIAGNRRGCNMVGFSGISE
jgi:hypothetical protein